MPAVGEGPLVAAAAELPICPDPQPLAHHAAPIGSDANVSVFVGGDYSVGGNAAESEGVLAVGGTARFDKPNGGVFNVGVVGFGSGIAPPTGSDMLRSGSNAEVGATTTVDVGHGIGGNVVAGGSAVPITRFETSGGRIMGGVADPLGPFAGMTGTIASRSAEYAALPTTGSASEQYRVVTFTGDGASATQAFEIPGTELGTANQPVSIRFARIPADARIIVNVLGSTAGVYPAGFFTDASSGQIDFGDPRFVELATHVMWNFAEATRVTIGTGDQLLGSVLVPRTDAATRITASTNGRLLIGGDLEFAGEGNEAHAFPFPEDEFECKPTVDPPAAVGGLTVRKTVQDPGGVLDPGRTYVGTWSCIDPAGAPVPGGTWRVVAGATEVLSRTLPVGSTCRIEESPPTAPAPGDPSYGWDPPTTTPETVTIGDGTVAEITVTNTVVRRTGGFEIRKALDDTSGAVDPATVFTGTWSCSVGSSVVAHGTWSLTAGAAPQRVDGVPLGARCTVAEDPSPDPVPGDPSAIWAPPTISPATVVVGEGAVPEVTVTNRIERVVGSFAITKAVQGAIGGVDPNAEYAFSWVCLPLAGERLTGTEHVRAGGVVPVEGIPAGSTCTVTEAAPPQPIDPSYVWDPPRFSVGGDPETEGDEASFVVPAGGGPVVSVAWTNSLRQRFGVLAVRKVLDDPQRVVASDDTYKILWNCTAPGGESPGGTSAVLADGASHPLALQLPYGSRCNVHEDLQLGSPAANGSRAFRWGVPLTDTSEVVIGEGGTDVGVIRITNVVDRVTGGATIAKVLDAPSGAVAPSTNYTGAVRCEDPSGAKFERTWMIRAGAPTVPLIDGLPDGTSCVVVEDPPAPPEAGYAWQQPVISPSSFVVRAGSSIAVSVRNTATAITTPKPPATKPPTETANPSGGGREKPGPGGLAETGAPAGWAAGAIGLAMLSIGAAAMLEMLRRRRRS